MQINELWKKLINYRQIREPELKKYPIKGATVDEINKLEEKLSIQLPESFKQSLMISNGEIELNENEDLSTWFGDWNILLNCEEIFNITEEYRKIYTEGVKFDYSYEIKNKTLEWANEFIVFLSNNCDYYAVLDMREGDQKGQVLAVDIEGGILAYWANSYEEWFKMAVDEVLEYGELRLETIEKKLHII